MLKCRSRFLICLIIIHWALACSSYAKPPQSSEYRITSKVTSFSQGEKKKFSLEVTHPYQMDLAIIKNSMAALAYQRKNFSWSDNKRVFASTFINRLAPQIVSHMAKAHDGQRITYQIVNLSGKILLRGDTFLTKAGLHWRITILNGKKRPIDDFSITGEFWKLAPRKNQAYKTIRPFKNLVQDMTNWIVIPKIRPQKSKRLPAPMQQDVKQSPQIMKKLQLLEELRGDGILNDKEYEAKRKKLLR
jgi:hypothetical protein